MPGLLYALIARCPVFKGKLASFDARDALKIKGVKAVVSTQPIAGPQFVSFIPHDIREGVAVVAGYEGIKGDAAEVYAARGRGHLVYPRVYAKGFRVFFH